MHGTRLIAFIGIGVLAATLPQARADEWNQKTIVTFSGPVEIPGRVLSPGTYVFKLADSQADRNIVQVYGKNEQHFYGTYLTIPDYRLRLTGKPVINFEERAAGSPEAVKAWFYPGDNYGHEFVYPKTKALALAKANNTAVPSMADNMTANTQNNATEMNAPSVQALKNTPLKAQQPSQQEVEITEVFPAQNPNPPAQSNNNTANNTQSNSNAHTARMPHTASPLPLIALMGLISLGAAASFRIAAKQSR